jgi:hypothetical protein
LREIKMLLWRPAAAALVLLVIDSIAGAALASPGYDHILADARGVVWRPREPRRSLGVESYFAAFNGSDNCWVGGRIIGTGKTSRTAPSALALGAGYGTSGTEVHLLEISKALDGVWIGPDAFDVRLEKILLKQITDTCLIADHQGDLIVDNLFFRNCPRLAQLRSRTAGSTLTIRNSVIRINNAGKARYRGRLFNRGALRSRTEVYFEHNVVVTGARS